MEFGSRQTKLMVTADSAFTSLTRHRVKDVNISKTRSQHVKRLFAARNDALTTHTGPTHQEADLAWFERGLKVIWESHHAPFERTIDRK